MRRVQVVRTDVGSEVPFAFYNDSLAQLVAPASGPVLGGTNLSIIAGYEGLALGSDFRCLYDLSSLRQQPAYASSWWPLLVVPATLSDARAQLSCTSPEVKLTDRQMLDGRGATLPISVSLNAQQFTLLPTELQLYESPLVAFISPACGPVEGGTRVAVIGDQLRSGSDYRCRLGEVEQAANQSTTPQGDLVHCFAPGAAAAAGAA